MEYGIQVGGEQNMPPADAAVRLLHHAFDNGINVIDTARIYGESERLVGAAIAGRRDELVVMSKSEKIRRELRGAELVTFVERPLHTSLRLLGTDAVDVYQIHSATAELLRRGEVVDGLDAARRAGKIRFLGASVYAPDAALAAIDDPRIDVVQVAYSMLDPSMDEQVIPTAAKRGVGVLTRSVLHRGVLTPKGAHGSAEEARLHQAALRLDFLFDERTRTLPQAAIRFVLSNPHVASALVGMDRLEQVNENIAVSDGRTFATAHVDRVRQMRPADPWAIQPQIKDAISAERDRMHTSGATIERTNS